MPFVGSLTQEAADHTHDDETQVHEHDEDLVLAARIDAIIAEAATREECG